MYIAIGLGLLGVALVYQYVFDEMPCVMCIQLRLWVWLFTIVAILGLVTIDRRVLNAIAHVSIVLVAIGIAERSYKIFGTERG
ncbi:MAG: disulfide bond formation protein B, partial [Gammaproteobacteria bacterium]|nr:disulfide bond formation protein B [Gammaproteobacteria bacterium]